MIVGIANVPLIVKEYQEAIDFYCGILGFEIIEDRKMENKRWIRLQCPGKKGSDILLSRAVGEKQLAAVGNQTGGRVLFFIHTDNFEEDYQNLKINNVEISEETRNEVYGKVLVFKDLYGNRIDLIEPIPELRMI
jgi:catechol 2,3-dioxygenase-like lactoylglutathione lyase family enzyme